MVINHNLKRLKSTIFVLISALLLIVYFNKISNADIKPNDKFSPQEVVEIQLTSLQNNSINNLGIYQCWLFAHPDNKKYTGPLDRFTSMIESKPYDVLLNSFHFKTKLIFQNKNDAKVEVLLDSKNKNKYKILWSLSKSKISNECRNCWMTIGVSQPYNLGPII